jgi:integrase
VFCSDTGGHLDYFAHLRRWHATLKRAKIERRHFHDLRHAFGSLAVKKWEPTKVQGYMGHAQLSTTMRYVHHAPAAKDAALLTEAIREESLAESVSPTVSRNDEFDGNSAQLSGPDDD